ncbi:MAG: hypothetical protein H3C27_07440 [Opitutaceae bacterium]|nr:hypothetical protein [Opitutaceae bacterium]
MPPAPIDDPAFNQLQTLVARLITQARREHPLGVTAYTPAAFGDAYPALYLRDFTYMAESAPELMPLEHVRDVIGLITGHFSPAGLCPERISNEGEVIYTCHGDQPVTDSPLFLIKLCSAYVRHGGDLEFIAERFSALERTMSTVPIEADTGLVWINPDHPHTAYGFTDTIAITGHHLFCSLLRLEAAENLAQLATQLGRTAAHWSAAAGQIRAHLPLLWSPDHELFLAGSQDCRQADIWGSAYTCAIGAVDEMQRATIARSLMRQRDRFLHRGQVRHLLYPECWQKLIIANEWTAPGRFQNGAHWGTATGWIAEVFEMAQPGSGVELLQTLVADFTAHGVWECVGPGGYARVGGNLSSACLPYASWKKLRARQSAPAQATA